MSTARAMGHDPVGTTRDGRDGSISLTLDNPKEIAEQLRDVGPIDVLINNAGVISPERQSPLDMDFDGFAQCLTVNTIAPLAVAKALLPQLRKSSAPKILSISSQMSWMGYRKSDRIAYRASKAALNKVMQGLATELEGNGIPVALVDPGWVRTDMGGEDADEDPLDVARGIIRLADNLTLNDTGKFFRFTGDERAF